uniref:Uncharacterized protein n=1 Tax=Meloidogyne hapla TaxID=6305 RepID=A0A1I8AZL3_MELHA
MFLCESGTQQINQKQVCDGIVNCKYDGSDEKYCQRSTGFEKQKNEIEFQANLAEEIKEPKINENELKQNSNFAFDQPPQLEELKEFRLHKDQQNKNNLEISPSSNNIQLKEKQQNLPLINSIAFQFEKPKSQENTKIPSINFIPGDYQTDVLNELNGEEIKQENFPLPSVSERIENNTLINQQEEEQNNLIMRPSNELRIEPFEQQKNNILINEKEKIEEKNKIEEINECKNKLNNNIKNNNLNNQNKTNCEEIKLTTNSLILNEKLNNNLTKNEIKNNGNNKEENEGKIKEKNSKQNNLLFTTIMPTQEEIVENNENNQEKDLLKNMAEKMRKMKVFEEKEEKVVENEEEENKSEENKLYEDEDENEEEEQKQILKRLYSKYGRRRANAERRLICEGDEMSFCDVCATHKSFCEAIFCSSPLLLFSSVMKLENECRE